VVVRVSQCIPGIIPRADVIAVSSQPEAQKVLAVSSLTRNEYVDVADSRAILIRYQLVAVGVIVLATTLLLVSSPVAAQPAAPEALHIWNMNVASLASVSNLTNIPAPMFVRSAEL